MTVFACTKVNEGWVAYAALERDGNQGRQPPSLSLRRHLGGWPLSPSVRCGQRTAHACMASEPDLDQLPAYVRIGDASDLEATPGL